MDLFPDLFEIAKTRLSLAERMLCETARDFIKEEWLSSKSAGGLPLVIECVRNKRFPIELVPLMGKIGFLGAMLPPEYGGAGIGPTMYGILNYEIERGDSSLRSFLSVTNGLVCHPIFAFGSEEQKRKWLPELCKGSVIGCFGLTEPEGGSDPFGNMKTRATPDGNSYIITGQKQWITNGGGIADIAIVCVYVGDEPRMLIVEKERNGFTQELIKHKTALVCSNTGNLVLEECRVPASNILPHAIGKKPIYSCLNKARYGIAWGAMGAAADCYNVALDYAMWRKIAKYQLIQDMLVTMLGLITRGQCFCIQLSHLLESEHDIPEHIQISLAKLLDVKWAIEVADLACGILGSAAVDDLKSPQRHHDNLMLAVRTYEGTPEMQKLSIGKYITGIDAIQ